MLPRRRPGAGRGGRAARSPSRRSAATCGSSSKALQSLTLPTRRPLMVTLPSDCSWGRSTMRAGCRPLYSALRPPRDSVLSLSPPSSPAAACSGVPGAVVCRLPPPPPPPRPPSAAVTTLAALSLAQPTPPRALLPPLLLLLHSLTPLPRCCWSWCCCCALPAPAAPALPPSSAPSPPAAPLALLAPPWPPCSRCAAASMPLACAVACTKWHSPPLPRRITMPVRTPFTLRCTSAPRATPPNLPRRTWKGVLCSVPSGCRHATTSSAPLSVDWDRSSAVPTVPAAPAAAPTTVFVKEDTAAHIVALPRAAAALRGV